jgi:hypothetical protein
MADEDHSAEPTQLTQPKGIDPKTGKAYGPVEIPVPKRGAWEKVLGRATKAIQKGAEEGDQSNTDAD